MNLYVGRPFLTWKSDEMEEGIHIVHLGKEALAIQLNGRIASRYPSTSLWSKLFEREIISNLRLPDGRIHEEYVLLLHYAAMAQRTGLIEGEAILTKIIASRKNDILKSDITFKKKCQYRLFFLNKNCYYYLWGRKGSG